MSLASGRAVCRRRIASFNIVYPHCSTEHHHFSHYLPVGSVCTGAARCDVCHPPLPRADAHPTGILNTKCIIVNPKSINFNAKSLGAPIIWHHSLVEAPVLMYESSFFNRKSIQTGSLIKIMQSSCQVEVPFLDCFVLSRWGAGGAWHALAARIVWKHKQPLSKSLEIESRLGMLVCLVRRWRHYSENSFSFLFDKWGRSQLEYLSPCRTM